MTLSKRVQERGLSGGCMNSKRIMKGKLKNKYSTDYEGIEKLELVHDGSISTDITIENNQVTFFSSYDSYDSNYISFDIKDWEEVKLFIDNQIAKSLGLKKPLLGEH